MNPLSDEQAEDLRLATLAYLASRFPAALPLRAIRRKVAESVDFQIDDDALNAALEYLKGDGYTAMTLEPLGTTAYWSATTTGVRHWERRGR